MKRDTKLDTTLFGNQQNACSDQQEYEKLVMEHMAEFVRWEQHVKPLLEPFTDQEISDGCGVCINSANRFKHEIPAKRRSVIMLAAMLRMNVTQANELLMRWAKYQRLYPKNPEDAIWIYILRNGGSSRPKELFDRYWAVYQELLREPASGRGEQATHLLAEELQNAKRRANVPPEQDAVFRDMMRQIIPAYESGYRKLAAYIDSQFVRLCDGQAGRLTPAEKELLRDNLKVTPRGLFRDNKHYLSTYYSRMRQLRSEHRVPERNFLISLGIRLAMSREQIDEMLELAGMASLCSKDKLESAITFYLEELFINFPSFFRDNPLHDGQAARVYRDLPPEQIRELGENSPLLRFDQDCEMPTEKMSAYIKRRLQETNIFTADEQQTVDVFLGLL